MIRFTLARDVSGKIAVARELSDATIGERGIAFDRMKLRHIAAGEHSQYLPASRIGIGSSRQRRLMGSHLADSVTAGGGGGDAERNEEVLKSARALFSLVLPWR